jgi:hypothetical protein
MAMKQATKRKLAGALSVLVVAWIGFLGTIDWAMHQPPEVFGRIMSHMPMPAFFLFPFETMWTQARHGSLSPGVQAPDFTVETLEAKSPLQLASLWTTKPVVLVFGSYT